MKHTLTVRIVFLLAPLASRHAAGLKLSSRLDCQVVQRQTPAKGSMRIAGEFPAGAPWKHVAFEARPLEDKSETAAAFDSSVVGRMTLSVPALTLVSPVWLLVPVRVSMPVPALVTASVPPPLPSRIARVQVPLSAQM